MTEQTSLAIIAISALILVLATIASCIALFIAVRRVMALTKRIEDLTEQVRASTLPAIHDVRNTLHSLSQVAGVAAQIARPIVATSAVGRTVTLLRALSLAGTVLTAARSLRGTFSRRPRAVTAKRPSDSTQA